MNLLQLIGIVLVLLGAVAVYGSAMLRGLLCGKKDADATFDMKENVIKLIGVALAMAGVVLILYG